MYYGQKTQTTPITVKVVNVCGLRSYFFCIITTGFMQAANKVFAQATVTASFKNATLSEILWEIQRQTDFTFVYSTNDVKQIKVQNLKCK